MAVAGMHQTLAIQCPIPYIGLDNCHKLEQPLGLLELTQELSKVWNPKGAKNPTFASTLRLHSSPAQNWGSQAETKLPTS